MVCVCPSGGCLSLDISARLEEAARTYAIGKLDIATSIYRDILALSPHEPGALHMLGVIAQQEGNAELALNWIDAALTVAPDFLEARHNRSVVLRAMGRNDEALQCVQKILDAAPRFAAAWDMAGQILKDENKLGEAEKCFALAIELQPGEAGFHGNYALLLYAQGDWHAAYAEACAAENLDPCYPPMLLGNILWAAGCPEKAAACFAKARSLMPDSAEVFASEAMARLQMGDMAEGFALWEHRPDLSPELAHIPFWQGQAVETLLLYEDQGLGDALQFLRFIPLLQNRAQQVKLRVRGPLIGLVTHSFPDVCVISETAPLPPFEARCRLSSLPFLFGTQLDRIPPAPYLKAPVKTICTLCESPKPRIGLVWAGNAKFHNDGARSLDFSLLDPLLSCCAPHLVSLQKEHSVDLAKAGVFDAAPMLHDFADTASLMEQLDLVISVDTATAHLAGALGKPVFVLLPFNSDWRWLMGREDSPWYASARLFRQQKPGDWDGVIAEVVAAVQKFIAGDDSSLRAVKGTGQNIRQNPGAVPL